MAFIMYWKSSLWVPVLILDCWHEDQMSAGSFKREGLDPIMHPSPLQVLSFSPWVLASCAGGGGFEEGQWETYVDCSAVVTLIDWALLVVIVAMETACLWGVWLFIYDWRNNTSLLLALPFSWSWILIIYGVTYLEAITDLPFAHILDSRLHKYFLKHVIVRFPFYKI